MTDRMDEDFEELRMWVANSERFTYEAATLLDDPNPEDALKRWAFRLVWEHYSTVADRRVRISKQRMELSLLRHRLSQSSFDRFDWGVIRAEVEAMGMPRQLPDFVKQKLW